MWKSFSAGLQYVSSNNRVHAYDQKLDIDLCPDSAAILNLI